MRSNYKTIGQLVERIDIKNVDGAVAELIGISIDKCFIKSVANTIGTDLTKYKVIFKNDFAVSLLQVSRDGKIPIACLKEYDRAIMSPAYVIFRVNDYNEILPEYLELWFKRTEFDREASFIAVGGVRGSMSWEEFCRIKVFVPTIEKQRNIVKAYKTIIDRIELKKKINDNLEATAQTIFKSQFIDYEDTDNSDFVKFEFGKYPANWSLVDLDTVVDVRDGTHDSPSPTETGKYLITSRHLLPYAVDRSNAYFISETDYNKANERSKVEYGDILFSMIGTIGIISFITDREIDFAIKNVGLFRTSQNPSMRYFILSYLKSKIVENYISSYTAGSTQSYVSLNVLRKIPLILPSESTLQKFEKQVASLFATMIENTYEIAKLIGLKDAITTSMSNP